MHYILLSIKKMFFICKPQQQLEYFTIRYMYDILSSLSAVLDYNWITKGNDEVSLLVLY